MSYSLRKIRSSIGSFFDSFLKDLRRIYWRTRLKDFGSSSTIYPFARIYSPHGVSIGENVSINDFVHIWGAGGIVIGDNSLIATHCVITSQSHRVDALGTGLLYRETNDNRPVRIGQNVWIGSGAIILPGIEIGSNSIVAAGSVVTKSVPPNSLYAGVPARLVRTLV